MNHPCLTRRTVLKVAAGMGVGAMVGGLRGAEIAGARSVREFHACMNCSLFEEDSELIGAVVEAGVGHVWLPAFFYGFWPYSMERLGKVRGQLERAGVEVHAINIGLGHPGDSLGDASQKIPLAPPVDRWKYAVSIDGQKTTGCSIHAPAPAENAAAMAKLAANGYSRVFVDDDFRLARTPGMVGGCFCDEHKKRFLEGHGFDGGNWGTLIDSIRARKRTKELDAWIEFQCDELGGTFKGIQAAAPEAKLGIMVMVFGAEKAGIRLEDYRQTMMRVGEEHFNDAGFGPVKGKCDELYSALFHRRFARADLAYSESTAFPSNMLSAKNLAAKFVVSTIADVRNTMVMSGITPFPREYWKALGPALKEQRKVHEVVAGAKLRGPFKHYWGEDSRRVSDDRPNSLFLASGVPFEVCDEPSTEGFTFLNGFDARAVAEGRVKSGGTVFVDEGGVAGGRKMGEEWGQLMGLKREVMGKFADVPVVVEEKPVVCAWYPEKRAVVLWNLGEGREKFTLRKGVRTWGAEAGGLGTCLVTEVG
ncbi:MAG TPA: hypothetical protein VFE58_09940 [Tepidisphaeraceae bacterium]|nr:hypothetical protein [Tepidisphaeraceae bacterium]